jgi:hypothetical protein
MLDHALFFINKNLLNQKKRIRSRYMDKKQCGGLEDWTKAYDS